MKQPKTLYFIAVKLWAKLTLRRKQFVHKIGRKQSEKDVLFLYKKQSEFFGCAAVFRGETGGRERRAEEWVKMHKES